VGDSAAFRPTHPPGGPQASPAQCGEQQRRQLGGVAESEVVDRAGAAELDHYLVDLLDPSDLGGQQGPRQ